MYISCTTMFPCAQMKSGFCEIILLYVQLCLCTMDFCLNHGIILCLLFSPCCLANSTIWQAIMLLTSTYNYLSNTKSICWIAKPSKHWVLGHRKTIGSLNARAWLLKHHINCEINMCIMYWIYLFSLCSSILELLWTPRQRQRT